MTRASLLVGLVAVAASALAMTSTARAGNCDQPADAQGVVAGRILLDRAETELKKKNVAYACELLDGAVCADATLQALMASADCHEQLGRTASATKRYGEAAARAATEGDDAAVARARARVAALALKLAYLRVRVAAQRRRTVVRVNGAELSSANYDVPVVHDPGRVVVRLEGDGLPVERIVELSPDGGTVVVELPTLLPVPPPRAAAALRPSSDDRAKTALIVGTILAAGLCAAVPFGGIVSRSWSNGATAVTATSCGSLVPLGFGVYYFVKKGEDEERRKPARLEPRFTAAGVSF